MTGIVSAAALVVATVGFLQELFIPTSSTVWLGVFSGAFLGFYAFIGFEDLVL